MVYTGNYLRVLTPRTVDGVTPEMENDRLVLKEAFMPLTALRELEEQNKRLPEILRKRIEIVTDDEDGNPVPVAKKSATSKK